MVCSQLPTKSPDGTITKVSTELSLFAPHSEDNQTAAAEPQHAAVGHLIGFSMTLGIFQSVASIVFYLCSSENGDFDVDCQDWFLRRTPSANPMMTYA